MAQCGARVVPAQELQLSDSDSVRLEVAAGKAGTQTGARDEGKGSEARPGTKGRNWTNGLTKGWAGRALLRQARAAPGQNAAAKPLAQSEAAHRTTAAAASAARQLLAAAPGSESGARNLASKFKS